VVEKGAVSLCTNEELSGVVVAPLVRLDRRRPAIRPEQHSLAEKPNCPVDWVDATIARRPNSS